MDNYMDVDEEPVIGRKRGFESNEDGENMNYKRQNTTQQKGQKRKFNDYNYDEEEENYTKINTTNQNRPSLDTLRGRRDAYYTQKFNSEKTGGLKTRRRRKKHRQSRKRTNKRRHSKR